jgi:hypothetical protein
MSTGPKVQLPTSPAIPRKLSHMAQLYERRSAMLSGCAMIAYPGKQSRSSPSEH